MKLKQKDFVMIGAFVFVALIIYVFFFTSLGFGDSGGETTSKAKGFGNFNTTVEKKPVEEFETKSEAYQAELQEETEREKQEQQLQETRESAQRAYKEGTGVNDLSSMLKKDEKKSPPLKEETQEEIIPVVTEKKPVKKSTSTTVKKSVTTTPIVKESTEASGTTAKKKRKGDPVFGDVSTTTTTSSVKATGGSQQGLGVVHQQTTAKQNTPVLIRVTEAFSIQQCEIKANSFLTGYCSYSSYGRMLITVSTINCNGKIIDVNLEIYDGYDGLEGIAIKAASDEQQVGKEVVGEAVGDAARKFGIRSVDRAVGSEKNRKMADPSVVINSGHKLILKEVLR